jgi:hypothetical protein
MKLRLKKLETKGLSPRGTATATSTNTGIIAKGLKRGNSAKN